MKILVSGKIPPIQGGVSRENWAACEQLARLGHLITIVTNAKSVEINFKQNLTSSDKDRIYKNDCGTGVNVFDIGKIKNCGIIPKSDFNNTRLVGALLEKYEEMQPDLIFGYYLEPYGVAAATVAKMTNCPYVLMHAGSDIGRFRQLPNVNIAFKFFAKDCLKFFTTSQTERLSFDLNAIGLNSEKLKILGPSCLEEEYSSHPLKADFALQPFSSNYDSEEYEGSFIPEILAPLENNILSGKIFGILGKIHPTKCSSQIIDALENLLENGNDVSLLACVGGYTEHLTEWFNKILSTTLLKHKTKIIPLMAPWNVPSFIDCCDSVFFLEHNFDLEYHSSRLPLEIIARNKVPILSKQAAKQLPFFPMLEHEENCLIVCNPLNTHEIAQLCLIVCNNEKYERMRANVENIKNRILNRIGNINRIAKAIQEL